MPVNRRTFLVLSASFVAGCAAFPGGAHTASRTRERIVNIGPAGQYLADGVYARFRDRGFFVVRQGANLFALSAICTHRQCKLNAGPEGTFHCPCHGSTFASNGRVIHGPARRNLPVFDLYPDGAGNLLVKLSRGEPFF